MAEVTGLLIGGLSLLALFETGMQAFEHIDDARSYGKEYQKSALKISVLHLRLARWAKGVELANDIRNVGNAEDHETVKGLLGQINDDIETAEGIAEKHRLKAVKANTSSPPDNDKELTTIEDVTKRVQHLALRRQKDSSIRQKTKWALFDQKKLNRLIEDLDVSISSLEGLFSAVRQQEVELAKDEASDLVPRDKDDDETAKTTMALLAEATTGTDSVLQAAIEQAVAESGSKHDFGGNFTSAENARVQIGDWVARGEKATGRGSKYHGNYSASGHVRVQYGDIYNGKHVFDD